MFSTVETLRYSCQLQLPDFGEEKQQLLRQSKVLLIGAGGLGCPASQYLVATGVGTITLADFDTVSIGNLHRQILFTLEEVGRNKAEVACKKLQQQNPHIVLKAVTEKVTASNVMQLIGDHDVIIDGTDNFETRYLVNDACCLLGKPLVYGAIYQYEGQVALWNVENADGSRSPNYRDIFPEVNAALIPNCAEGGVIPTLAGIIGTLQANEAIKLITQTGESLAGKMLLFNAQTLQSRIINTGPVSHTVIRQLPLQVPVALMSVEEFHPHREDGSFELIDVRSVNERNAFHLGGRHIPIAELESVIGTIAQDKPVIFYCASGKRSAEAVKIYTQHFPGAVAYSLDGGVKGWKEKMVRE